MNEEYLSVVLAAPGSDHPFESDDPDGQYFYFKANNVERQIDVNLLLKTIVANIPDHIASGDTILQTDVVNITADVQGMSGDAYPGSYKYSNHDEGFTIELEDAARTWGPELNEGMATLYWGKNTNSREINGHIGSVSVVERVADSSDVAGTYQVTLEFAEIDTDISILGMNEGD